LQVANVPLEPAERLRLKAEAQADLVAGAAEDTGSVVAEAGFVKGAKEPGFQVGLAVERVDEASGVVAGEGEGDGVQGEVAAEEVVAEGAGMDGRQCAGSLVGLGAGAGDVDPEASALEGGRAQGGRATDVCEARGSKRARAGRPEVRSRSRVAARDEVATKATADAGEERSRAVAGGRRGRGVGGRAAELIDKVRLTHRGTAAHYKLSP
jgi:hypothetical protein